jgi:hypothetical protein
MKQSPIQFLKSSDGTYELTYFGKVAGWARKAIYPTRPGETLWRAVSVHGDVRHVYSLNAARSALLEMYH